MYWGLKFHHVCIIAYDYAASVHFYQDLLGLVIRHKSYSEHQKAQKIEFYCGDEYVIEMFVKDSVEQNSNMQSLDGLNHLSFYVEDPESILLFLEHNGVRTERTKLDANTGKKYGFAYSPEGIKIEFYERTQFS